MPWHFLIMHTAHLFSPPGLNSAAYRLPIFI
jgi:hypothetical protein